MVELSDDKKEFVDSLIEGSLRDIYKQSKTTIPYELYQFSATGLAKAFIKGYGVQVHGPDWSLNDNVLLNRVQNNLFAFSGAKCYAEFKTLGNAVYENGKLLPFSEFREKALAINRQYNIAYLNAERNHVMRAGTMGSLWADIEADKDLFPYLMYVTRADSHVRDEHAALHGLIYPVDDKFWSSYYPPNGWGCRCTVQKLSERDYNHRKKNGQIDSMAAQKLAGKSTPKAFRNNVGTSDVINKNGHPYFKASKEAGEMQLSATKHYGMKKASEIYGHPAKLAKYKASITSQQQYNEFWKQNQNADGNIVLTDKNLNIQATMDKAFKQKMLNKNRHLYFDEAISTFNKPDEVWCSFQKSGRFKKEEFNVFVKYYEDKPVVLLVNKTGRVDSFYKLDNIEHIEQFRLGLLKQKK